MLEEEIKHIKTNQFYAVDQIQFMSMGSFSVASRDVIRYGTQEREVKIRVYATGAYLDRPLQIFLQAKNLPHVLIMDMYWDETYLNYRSGVNQNEMTALFFHGALPAEWQDPFTIEVELFANMDASYTWEYV